MARTKGEGWIIALLVTLLFITACVISFGIISGILWVIFWAFNLQFTWKIAIGVWFGLFLIKLVFGNKSKGEEK
jgi:hypothetical protein